MLVFLLTLALIGCGLPPTSTPVDRLTVLNPFVGKIVVWHGRPVGDKGRAFLRTDYGAIEVDRAWDFESGPKRFNSVGVVTVVAKVEYIDSATVGQLPPGIQTNLREGELVPAHYLLTHVRILEIDGIGRSAPIRLASLSEIENDAIGKGNPIPGK